MGFAVPQMRRFAAGVLCTAALVLSSTAQAQVADDPEVEGLAICREFRLHLEETPVLVIELPWARSQNATAKGPRRGETPSGPLAGLVGYTVLHPTYTLPGLDQHVEPRFTWTLPESRRISWAWRLLCLADHHGDSPLCWENNVTRTIRAEAFRMGIEPPGTWAD